MGAIVEGARLIREYHGVYTDVLTYRKQCDACGYLAPKTFTIVSLLSEDASYNGVTYEAEGFSCPDCTTYQAVRIQLEPGREAVYKKD